MRKARFAAAALLALSILALHGPAQDKPKTESRMPATTLKLQVTFAELEADKKVSNLPYMLFVRAADPGPIPTVAKVRIGSRVPVATGNDKGATQFQYVDVGTNIDARGYPSDDGQFTLYLNLERSWVEGNVPLATEGPSAGAGDVHFKEPVIRQFKTELELTMHDGQTIQTTQAADPLSGRIVTITVTMNVVK